LVTPESVAEEIMSDGQYRWRSLDMISKRDTGFYDANFLSRSGLKSLLILMIAFVTINLSGTGCSPPSSEKIKQETFSRLNKIMLEKKGQLLEHFSSLRENASAATGDERLVELFRAMKDVSNQGNPADSDLVARLSLEIDSHFVFAYGDFYDLLFVDSDGKIFHSIKQETDYLTNLFTGHLRDTFLATSLLADPTAEFVDFEYYSPSRESGAFFVSSMMDRGKRSGWVILQVSANRVNQILADRTKLGRTGEVYLINQDLLMLSESRFTYDSSILRLKVDTRSARNAFSQKSGEIITKDYRDITVFSSFECFELLGATWALIVEIDEEEILADHFLRHGKRYHQPLIEIAGGFIPAESTSFPVIDSSRDRINVDINEVLGTTESALLTTRGVSTCTGLVISMPGRFSYLAHISPVDEVYSTKHLRDHRADKHRSQFLRETISRIKHFDLRPFEIQSLKFYIVANHDHSIGNIANQLLEQGVELKQITFLYNPEADCANIYFDHGASSLTVEWVTYGNTPERIFCSSGGYRNLSEEFKAAIGY
jgi:hypothetical protein